MNNETDTEEIEFLFVKLVNGENLLCASKKITKTDYPFLEAIEPIEVVSFKMPINGVIMERYIMQKWIPFCDANIIQIPHKNILFIGELSNMFKERYLEYLKTTPNEDFMNSEEDDEDFDEIDEMLQREITETKKWLH